MVYNHSGQERQLVTSCLPQLVVMCTIETECSYNNLVLVDREVLRNRQLRQYADPLATIAIA